MEGQSPFVERVLGGREARLGEGFVLQDEAQVQQAAGGLVPRRRDAHRGLGVVPERLGGASVLEPVGGDDK